MVSGKGDEVSHYQRSIVVMDDSGLEYKQASSGGKDNRGQKRVLSGCPLASLLTQTQSLQGRRPREPRLVAEENQEDQGGSGTRVARSGLQNTWRLWG